MIDMKIQNTIWIRIGFIFMITVMGCSDHRDTDEPITPFNIGQGVAGKPEFVIQEGHDVCIEDIAVDPAGKFIVSADYAGKIKMWNVRTGQLIRTYHLDGSQEVGTRVVIDPKGRFLVVGGDVPDNRLRIWSLSENKVIHTLRMGRSRTSPVAMDPNGRFIIGVGWSKTHVWDAGSFEFLTEIDGGFQAIAAGPAGKFVYAGTSSGHVRQINIRTGKTRKRFKAGSISVRQIAVSPRGDVMITAGWKGDMKIWSMKDFKLRAVIENADATAIAFDPKGEYIVCGTKKEHINILSIKKKGVERTIRRPERYEPSGRHCTGIQALAVDRKSEYIVAGGEKGTLRIWELATGDVVKKLSGGAYKPSGGTFEMTPDPHLAGPNGLAQAVEIRQISEDMRYLVLRTDMMMFNVWDLQSLRVIKHLGPGENPKSCELDPLNRFIASGGLSDTIRLYSLASGALVHNLKEPHGLKMTKWLVFDPSGKRLISMHIDKTSFTKTRIMNFWDVETGKCVGSTRNLATYHTFQTDPAGRYIAGMGSKKTVDVWKIENGDHYRSFPMENPFYQCVDFMLGGRVLVFVDSDKRISLWDLESGRRLKSPPPERNGQA